MDHTQQTHDDLRPLAGTDAAAAPPRSGFTLRGRTWVYAATLAAAGVLAGSGTAYAVEPPSPTVHTHASRQAVV